MAKHTKEIQRKSQFLNNFDVDPDGLRILERIHELRIMRNNHKFLWHPPTDNTFNKKVHRPSVTNNRIITAYVNKADVPNGLLSRPYLWVRKYEHTMFKCVNISGPTNVGLPTRYEWTNMYLIHSVENFEMRNFVPIRFQCDAEESTITNVHLRFGTILNVGLLRFFRIYETKRRKVEEANTHLENVLHYSPNVASKIINTSVTLHNLCMNNNLPDPEPGDRNLFEYNDVLFDTLDEDNVK